MLTLLHNVRPHLRWKSELTPLRFPLLPNQSYTALDLKLHAESVLFCLWEFYADVKITAVIDNAPELVESSADTFQNCPKIQYEVGQISINTLEFVDLDPPVIHLLIEQLKAYELTLHDELTDLLNYLMPKLGLQTMWLAPGVGPVKIETLDGYAELIDYDIKPTQ